MEEKAQILADKLKPLMILIDGCVDQMTDEDYDLLNEARNGLAEHIKMQQSAATLTLAFGIAPDTLDEEYKVKTLDKLIDFLKLRKEYKEKKIEHIKEEEQKNKNREELAQIFKNM